MPDESPEMIEHRMSETRDSLTQKINALENQVVDTLHNATSTVSGLLDSVKTVVPDTIQGVQDAVSEQVNTTFNLTKHTREKPWAMVGGAAALGFISGMMLFRRVYAAPTKDGYAASSAPQSAASMPTTSPSAAPSRPVKLPGWLDEIVDRLGTKLTEEVRRIGELAVDTASSSLQKTVETSLPRLFNLPESDAARAERVANGFHDVPSHM
jgi:ElaB/YqjD/DUF883 family membrane-anchored ribosome-binding protein